NGLVLVDTGYGLADIADPRRRIGPMRHLLKPAFDPDETAARQVQRLGFGRDDVRHIVITHFDLDHIGGLADFPAAQVHVTSAEIDGAIRTPSWRERLRYRAVQWEHHPVVVEHSADGESWRGFATAKELDAVSPGVVLIPLPGHTRGHACVAVDTGDGWILHCGDAFYHRGEIDGRTSVPRSLKLQERVTAVNFAQLRDNQRRIAELYARGEPDLLIICAHDAAQFPR
ncbi:MAG TPA: MBL fold metallo-hydrolase, partial [Mycobacterium sp.]|nr:MBL fold metallo-hydrolase [Mycobacterium sp.]